MGAAARRAVIPLTPDRFRPALIALVSGLVSAWPAPGRRAT
jgi:hypothetical protein